MMHSVARRISIGCRRLGVIALFASTMNVHAQDQLARIKAAGELVIGTEMQFAPFDFLDNGQEQGFNKDFFEQLGKDMGVAVRSIDLPWPSVLPGLEAGKFDIVSGPILITPARAQRYEFTLPIADGTVALLRRANDPSIRHSADIAGKAVGGGKGSAQLDQLKSFVATLPGTPDVREYTDNNQAYADLAAGRIAAVGNSLPNVAYAAQKRPEAFAVVLPPLGEAMSFGYLGRKGADSRTVIAAIDVEITQMTRDGRLAALQKKWFGLAVDTSRGSSKSGDAIPFRLAAFTDALPFLLKALPATLGLSLIGLVVGFIVAIAVCCARLSTHRLTSAVGGAYVRIFRGIPLLVQLLFAYYFLPFIGINVPSMVAAAAALSLCEAAYLAEILRGGFLAIPRGQLEAAQMLGLPRWITVLRIQVPQALRLTLPPLINEAVMLVKASSLISVVGVADVTRTAQNIAASTYRPLEAYMAAALVYFIINGALSLAGHVAERHMQGA